jgi:hypothetical protein
MSILANAAGKRSARRLQTSGQSLSASNDADWLAVADTPHPLGTEQGCIANCGPGRMAFRAGRSSAA